MLTGGNEPTGCIKNKVDPRQATELKKLAKIHANIPETPHMHSRSLIYSDVRPQKTNYWRNYICICRLHSK